MREVNEMIILMMPFSKTMFSSTKTTDTTQHITLLVLYISVHLKGKYYD